MGERLEYGREINSYGDSEHIAIHLDPYMVYELLRNPHDYSLRNPEQERVEHGEVRKVEEVDNERKVVDEALFLARHTEVIIRMIDAVLHEAGEVAKAYLRTARHPRTHENYDETTVKNYFLVINDDGLVRTLRDNNNSDLWDKFLVIGLFYSWCEEVAIRHDKENGDTFFHPVLWRRLVMAGPRVELARDERRRLSWAQLMKVFRNDDDDYDGRSTDALRRSPGVRQMIREAVLQNKHATAGYFETTDTMVTQFINMIPDGEHVRILDDDKSLPTMVFHGRSRVNDDDDTAKAKFNTYYGLDVPFTHVIEYPTESHRRYLGQKKLRGHPWHPLLNTYSHVGFEKEEERDNLYTNAPRRRLVDTRYNRYFSRDSYARDDVDSMAWSFRVTEAGNQIELDKKTFKDRVSFQIGGDDCMAVLHKSRRMGYMYVIVYKMIIGDGGNREAKVTQFTRFEPEALSKKNIFKQLRTFRMYPMREIDVFFSRRLRNRELVSRTVHQQARDSTTGRRDGDGFTYSITEPNPLVSDGTPEKQRIDEPYVANIRLAYVQNDIRRVDFVVGTDSGEFLITYHEQAAAAVARMEHIPLGIQVNDAPEMVIPIRIAATRNYVALLYSYAPRSRNVGMDTTRLQGGALHERGADNKIVDNDGNEVPEGGGDVVSLGHDPTPLHLAVFFRGTWLQPVVVRDMIEIDGILASRRLDGNFIPSLQVRMCERHNDDHNDGLRVCVALSNQTVFVYDRDLQLSSDRPASERANFYSVQRLEAGVRVKNMTCDADCRGFFMVFFTDAEPDRCHTAFVKFDNNDEDNRFQFVERRATRPLTEDDTLDAHVHLMQRVPVPLLSPPSSPVGTIAMRYVSECFDPIGGGDSMILSSLSGNDDGGHDTSLLTIDRSRQTIYVWRFWSNDAKAKPLIRRVQLLTVINLPFLIQMFRLSPLRTHLVVYNDVVHQNNRPHIRVSFKHTILQDHFIDHRSVKTAILDDLQKGQEWPSDSDDDDDDDDGGSEYAWAEGRRRSSSGKEKRSSKQQRREAGDDENKVPPLPFEMGELVASLKLQDLELWKP